MKRNLLHQNLRHRMIQSLALVCGFMLCAPTIAQIRIEMPDIPDAPFGGAIDLGVIMDGTMFSSGGMNSSVSMTIENGVKKIKAVENGVKTSIEEEEGRLVVRVTRQYGAEDMDVLMEEHPDLYMSMKDFPAETEDAESVEVTVGVTKKYEASSPDELKEKHPKVYETYKKYSGGAGVSSPRVFRGMRGGGIILPEIRFEPAPAPALLEIAPDEIRVFGEDELNKKNDKKESDDKDKDT